MEWNMDLKRASWVCPTSRIKRLRYGHLSERPLFWEVLAHVILDILTELEAFNVDSRLFLKSHNLDQLKAMESNMSIEQLQVLIQHGKDNITIKRHKEKPDTRQSITRGDSLQLYRIERKKARAANREQELVNRVWEEETHATPGKKPNAEDSSDTDKEEIQESEAHGEIVEEIIIDELIRDGEYTPQTRRMMDSRTGRSRDLE